MKIYQANRTSFSYILIFYSLFACFVFYLLEDIKVSDLALLILPLIFLLWLFFSTKYYIMKNNLHYHSGFFKGKIDILKINKIIVGKTLWAGLKPALSTKGLIITYNSFEDIYIAPKNNEELIKDLVSINPNIVLIFN